MSTNAFSAENFILSELINECLNILHHKQCGTLTDEDWLIFAYAINEADNFCNGAYNE